MDAASEVVLHSPGVSNLTLVGLAEASQSVHTPQMCILTPEDAAESA